VAKGRIVLNRRAVDLAASVERCLTALMQTTDLPGRALRKRLEPVWIHADETRIDQVITNLITNAIKYTPAGGQIEVTVTGAGDEVLLCVRDNGVGIEPSMLSRIFDVFVQGDHSLARTLGGLGLGLALVRRLTELHDGSVAVESEGLGRGAAFTVRLPRAEPMSHDRPSSPASASPRRRRILIVEDNADGRELLRTMLQAQGHEVFQAGDGETAIRQARELRPDVVIVDIGLPGIDGYEVAARLRAPDSGLVNLRLFALTGYGTERDRRRASDAGFDAHLTKPVELERLIRLLA
jgi:two-component system, sensor histidine kinase